MNMAEDSSPDADHSDSSHAREVPGVAVGDAEHWPEDRARKRTTTRAMEGELLIVSQRVACKRLHPKAIRTRDSGAVATAAGPDDAGR